MNLRTKLKQETTDAHNRVDNLIRDLKPFASDHGYGTYLLGMLHLHEYCRHSLGWVESNSKLGPRTTGLDQLIRSDLATLGFASSPETMREQLTIANTAEEAWGEAYVMEGSSVGGSYMFREAEKALPDSIGKTYLAQLALDAGSRWKGFVHALAAADYDSSESQNLNHERTIEAANHVFDKAFTTFSTLTKMSQTVGPSQS